MQNKFLFDPTKKSYINLIDSIAIIGYKESKIKEYFSKDNKENLNLDCLFVLPESKSSSYNSVTYNLMFPDKNYKIIKPKYFSLTLTDEYGQHKYMYNLKFSEKFKLPNGIIERVPLIISICSFKEDYKQFKELLYIFHQIIISEPSTKSSRISNIEVINDFKKIELLNIIFFCLQPILSPPHSLTHIQIIKSLSGYESIEDLDFYHSSNCEIPCCKIDTDIDILFSILDMSIIVKLIFGMLTEKQIVIRSSYTSVLYLILPSLLKLIFPFQWIHTFIPVLPIDRLGLLEKPGPFLYGILSDLKSINELIRNKEGRVVVDADTNEIYDLEIYSPLSKGEQCGLVQGLNILKVTDEKICVVKEKSRVSTGKSGKQPVKNDKSKPKNSNKNQENTDQIEMKLKPVNGEKGNLIIDCTDNVIYIDKSLTYLDEDEWKKIKKNIQYLKNPESFSIDNFERTKDKGIFISSETDDIIYLSNRSFSYNIQNIFVNLFLDKMSYVKKKFMEVFKDTNIYKIYTDFHKYQNDAGNAIIKNIEKTVNYPRNINNSFEINYSLKAFPALKIINELGSTEKDSIISENIKQILNNYLSIKDPVYSLKKYDRKNRFNQSKISSNLDSNPLKSGNLNSTKKRSHVLTGSFVSESLGNKVFLPKSNKDKIKEFLFYTKSGFLSFANEFFSYFKNKKIDIVHRVYGEKIEDEIINLISNNKKIGKRIADLKGESIQNNDKSIQNNDKSIDSISSNNDEAENNDNIILFNQIKNIRDTNTSDCNSNKMTINSYKDYGSRMTRITEGLEEGEKYSNENEYKLNNHYQQYYTFLAFYLEKIKNDKESLDYFNANFKGNVDIDQLIILIYEEAYDSGNTIEFPFFNYYSFLKSLSYENINKIKTNNNYKELEEIYTNTKNTIKEKHERDERRALLQRQSKLNRLNTTAANSIRSNPFNQAEKFTSKQTNPDVLLKENFLSDKNIPNPKISINNEAPLKPMYNTINTAGTNFSTSFNSIVVVNNSDKFTPEYQPSSWTFIKEISQLITTTFPSHSDLSTMQIEDILNSSHEKSKTSSIIELIAELKLIKLEKIKEPKQRIFFWVNCFNYLLLFAIFYNNWYVKSEEDWKKILKNVYYNIGGKEISFNDMQFIIFHRIIFFGNSLDYKPQKFLRELTVKNALKNEGKVSFDKDMEEYNMNFFSFFSLYLPIKDLIGPSVIYEGEWEKIMKEKNKYYFSKFIKIDKNNIVYAPEMIFMVDKNFFSKNFGKYYYKFFDKKIGDIINSKKYKEITKTKTDWEINFNNLY